MAGSLIKIKGIIDKLSTAERKIATYILAHPTEISKLSIGELAQKSGASEATVVRFCRILDYDGYKDFKIDITKDIAYMEKDTAHEKYSDIELGDNIEAIIRNVSYNNRKAIENTLEILSIPQIEKAVEALDRAERIEFYGVGASYIIALDAFQKFCRINKIVNAHSDSHMQVMSATNLKKGDVAVAISYSGETKETYDAIKIAKESKATTISITKYGQSSISDLCDINLFVASPEIAVRSGAMSSRIAQLNIIDILFAGVASKNFDDIQRYLENTREVVKLKKLK